MPTQAEERRVEVDRLLRGVDRLALPLVEVVPAQEEHDEQDDERHRQPRHEPSVMRMTERDQRAVTSRCTAAKATPAEEMIVK
jgi:hypothetical protein